MACIPCLPATRSWRRWRKRALPRRWRTRDRGTSRRDGMGNSSFLRGAAVVVLAIALMECGYRVVYWYWLSVSTPGEAAADLAHMRSWLTVAVVLGLAWM